MLNWQIPRQLGVVWVFRGRHHEFSEGNQIILRLAQPQHPPGGFQLALGKRDGIRPRALRVYR